ncbi:hypothetical protein BDN70DRAFT_871044 [Pholiota conissans]|uniref:Uncharacterized protein n=1 Tax=Pholiota conissans TaxID=109636 RepID=A0A9P6CYW5_9AGAR|nr:hypothetical protein BDN70DRAFT_871044 [Pholiota conissans]
MSNPCNPNIQDHNSQQGPYYPASTAPQSQATHEEPSLRRGVKINYELPKTVQSIRDGWQWTSSSGAVVSGLLAASAAQLLGFFKGANGFSDQEPRFQNLVLVFCYAALFLNISATIGSFLLTDNLGELDYRAARKKSNEDLYGSTSMGAEEILRDFGASSQWEYMLFHWLAMFYLGILSLIVAVLAFVWLEETRAIAITMTLVVAFTIIPVSYFILLRPIVEPFIKPK